MNKKRVRYFAGIFGAALFGVALGTLMTGENLFGYSGLYPTIIGATAGLIIVSAIKKKRGIDKKIRHVDEYYRGRRGNFSFYFLITIAVVAVIALNLLDWSGIHSLTMQQLALIIMGGLLIYGIVLQLLWHDKI